MKRLTAETLRREVTLRLRSGDIATIECAMIEACLLSGVEGWLVNSP